MKGLLNPQRVAFITLSEITRDLRIQRMAELLTQRGHEVRVYTYQYESNCAREIYHGFEIIRLPMPIDFLLNIDAFCAAMGDLMPLVQSLLPELLQQPDSFLAKPVASIANSGLVHPKLLRFASKVKRVALKQTNLLPTVRTRPVSPAGSPATQYRVEMGQDPDRDLRQTRQFMQMNLGLYQAVGNWSTHVYACDLECLFAGVMLKQKHDPCLIYDAHEIWPHEWPDGYRSAQFFGYFTQMERLMVKYPEVRLTIGDGLAQYFQYAYDATFTVIYNAPSVKLLCSEDVLRRRSPRRGLLYHGWLKPYRGLEEVITMVPMLEDCRIAFRGYAPPDYETELRNLVSEKKLDHLIEFLPKVDALELVGKATEFDIGLLPFPKLFLNNTYVLPNKFWEYMMAGLALVSHDLSNLKKLITEHQMGIVVDIHQPLHVAQQINGLIREPDRLDAMRRNAWQAARDIYNWENLSQIAIRLFEQVGL